jgi:hypothetical protein
VVVSHDWIGCGGGFRGAGADMRSRTPDELRANFGPVMSHKWIVGQG